MQKRVYTPWMFIIVLFLFIQAVEAQKFRATKPNPGPAPVVKIGEYQQFKLDNGLEVFVVENRKIPRVTFSLVFDHDPFFEGSIAGYSEIAGQLVGTATTTRTKDQIDEETDFIGASLSASATGMQATSLSRHTPKLLELMSDIAINAVFTPDELEKARTRTLSGLSASIDDPESISERVGAMLVHGSDHPYGEVVTEQSVKNISLDDCENYYRVYYRPNNAYMAVVGDISLAEAKALIEQYFSSWQPGEIPRQVLPSPASRSNREVAIVDRPNSVQSVITVLSPLDLRMNSKDLIAARITNTVLGGGTYRLFDNLREKHGYTYGAYSTFDIQKHGASFKAFTDVRNEVTDSAINEILYEMTRLRTERVPVEELERVKNNMAGNFALSLERPQTVASFALNTRRYNLPADFYSNYLKNLAAVNPDEVYAVAQKYILPYQSMILVVGKAEEIAGGLTKFSDDGSINYYDVWGNPVDPNAQEDLPEGLTGNAIVESYLKAIGGKENIEKVMDITQQLSVTIQGMNLQMVTRQKQPGLLSIEMTMGGNILTRTTFDGEKGKVSGMQGNMELEGKELENLKWQAILFPESRYDELGFEVELKGSEKIDGIDTWQVEVNTPGGRLIQEFFEKETGLKKRTTLSEITPMGPMTQVNTYGDYREVNGVMIPHQLHQQIGPQQIDAIVESVSVNTGIEEKHFE